MTVSQALTSNPIKNFRTVAEMVANKNLKIGQIALTAAYFSSADAGAAEYEIVAAGTGTADGGGFIDLTGSGVQARLIPKSRLIWDQFGAVGDGTTQDQDAMQATLEYAKDIALVWREDDRPLIGDFKAHVTVTGRVGAVYAMGSGISVDIDNRGLILEDFAVKAVGEDWATSDFMFATGGGNATFITLRNLQVNCSHKCSGIDQRSNTWSHNCRVFNLGGEGIRGNGTRCYIYEPVISQWSVNDEEFYTPSKFTANGIRISSDDVRVFGGEVGWCKHNIHIDGNVANIHIVNVHLFNGMEYFAENIDQETGLTAVGRNDPNIYIGAKDNPAQRPNVFIYNCYIDNGHIEAYHTSVTLRDNSYHSNSIVSPSGALPWHRFHAEEPGSYNRAIIEEAEVGVMSRPREWVEFVEDGSNTWIFDDTAIEAATWNTADQSNSPFTLHGGALEVSTSTSIKIAHGTGSIAYYEFSDNNTTARPRIGSNGDAAHIQSDEGAKFSEVGGADYAQITPTGIIPVKLAAAPSSPVEGQTYYDTTLNKMRTWNGSSWQDHW